MGHDFLGGRHVMGGTMALYSRYVRLKSKGDLEPLLYGVPTHMVYFCKQVWEFCPLGLTLQ